MLFLVKMHCDALKAQPNPFHATTEQFFFQFYICINSLSRATRHVANHERVAAVFVFHISNDANHFIRLPQGYMFFFSNSSLIPLKA